MWNHLVLKQNYKFPFVFFLKAAEEDSGTETDDETGGPDEGKPKQNFLFTSSDKFGQVSIIWKKKIVLVV